MGFTKTTIQIQAERLTFDGQGGVWWIDFDVNNRTRNLGWQNQGEITTPGSIFARATFRDLIADMISNGISLPPGNSQFNIEDIAEREQLQAQFKAPALTNANLAVIAANFELVDFLVFFGVFPLVARFFRLGLLTLTQLADTLIGLGQRNKIDRQKAETVTQVLLDEGTISQTAKDNFLARWDNEVDS